MLFWLLRAPLAGSERRRNKPDIIQKLSGNLSENSLEVSGGDINIAHQKSAFTEWAPGAGPGPGPQAQAAGGGAGSRAAARPQPPGPWDR